ncbi:MAG: CotH kinase family protein [Prevotella sp.]|nr:CotH kinase family protein [Prevotella sp.]
MRRLIVILISLVYSVCHAWCSEEQLYLVGWLNNWNKTDQSYPLTTTDGGQTWEITVDADGVSDGNSGWFKVAPASAYGKDNFWDYLYCAPYNGCQELSGTMLYGNEGAWLLPASNDATTYTIRIMPDAMRFEIVIGQEERQDWSGTLPVMFIKTDAPVTSKEYYVNGTYYIDALGLEGYESLGSAETPLQLQIKGRGNYTWTSFDKKPYRLKLADGAKPLGMRKSKHFTLLAHPDDDLVFLRNTVGFELSRLLGMNYTPEQQPVEVVLNGDYIGLYMLTDKIRVGKNRVEITEQANNETDENIITGGWLVEIDNYEEDGQICFNESNGQYMRFTLHSPDTLSSAQRSYMMKLLQKTDKAIYTSDKSSTLWEQYIDPDTLARFYIVQEVMDNAESFHGSCYIHKERGNTRLEFGPVWDFGNSYHRSRHHFVYDNPPFSQHWIGEIARYPRFQQQVKSIWQHFLLNDFWKLDAFIDSFVTQITTALKADGKRWSQYRQNDVENRRDDFKQRLKEKMDFLRSKWGNEASGIVTAATSEVRDSRWFTLDGQVFAKRPTTPGVYLHEGRKVVVGK